MGIISDWKMFFCWHKMLAYLLALGYIILISIIYVLSAIIALQNEKIDTLEHLIDIQYNTKTYQYPNKQKSEKKHYFIRVSPR